MKILIQGEIKKLVNDNKTVVEEIKNSIKKFAKLEVRTANENKEMEQDWLDTNRKIVISESTICTGNLEVSKYLIKIELYLTLNDEDKEEIKKVYNYFDAMIEEKTSIKINVDKDSLINSRLSHNTEYDIYDVYISKLNISVDMLNKAKYEIFDIKKFLNYVESL